MRNRFTEEEALQRINAQLPLADKVKGASHVIDNTGNVESTEKQVEQLYMELRRSKKHWRARAIVVVFMTGVVMTVYKLYSLIIY